MTGLIIAASKSNEHWTRNGIVPPFIYTQYRYRPPSTGPTAYPSHLDLAHSEPKLTIVFIVYECIIKVHCDSVDPQLK